MQNEDQKKAEKFTKEDFLEGLKQNKFKKIIFMTGAGISVSAGIPDFRSKGTGLYDNLQEYDLPSPQAIFDIDYFQEHPQAFYKLAQSFLSLDKYDATLTHHFCKMIQERGVVQHYLTQNIDNLESKAGFTQEQIVQAHGANFGAICSKCRKTQDRKTLESQISKGEIMYCSKDTCKGPVKPEITFFGEQLPKKFLQIFETLKGNCDLLIIMGTALAVSPFNSVVTSIDKKCPKILINMENTKAHGFDFENEQYPERLLWKGKCDEVVEEISQYCGFQEELFKRAKYQKKESLDKQIDSITDSMNQLKIEQNEEKKVDPAKDNKDEVGPIMGLFAVQPLKECPHCIPDEHITSIKEFSEIKITDPCKNCENKSENWICLKCMQIGCSRYVNSHMSEHNQECKHPIALSFADFSYWCYECDSYVISKHLDHVKHFYPQKFGENASVIQEYAEIMASKHKN